MPGFSLPTSDSSTFPFEDQLGHVGQGGDRRAVVEGVRLDDRAAFLDRDVEDGAVDRRDDLGVRGASRARRHAAQDHLEAVLRRRELLAGGVLRERRGRNSLSETMPSLASFCRRVNSRAASSERSGLVHAALGRGQRRRVRHDADRASRSPRFTSWPGSTRIASMIPDTCGLTATSFARDDRPGRDRLLDDVGHGRRFGVVDDDRLLRLLPEVPERPAEQRRERDDDDDGETFFMSVGSPCGQTARRASTGLIFTARRAGIKPARTPRRRGSRAS
jgi:hypothetical protein